MAKEVYADLGSDTRARDVNANDWYAGAVAYCWDNGLFGTNGPVIREQIAAIHWRYAGSPAAGGAARFTDQASIRCPAMANAADGMEDSAAVHGRSRICSPMPMYWTDSGLPLPLTHMVG